MKNHYQCLYLFPIIFALVCLISCKGQNKSEINHSKEKTPLPFIETHISAVDSVLNFKSRIGSIFEDSKGNYWFISHNAGVCKFDGNAFTYFGEKQGLKQVRAIHEDALGNILFGIEDALIIFDGQSFTKIYPEKESKLITESFQFSKQDFHEKWKKERSHFWFSAFSKNGVYRYDGKKLMHLTLPIPKDYPVFDENGHHPEHGWDLFAVYSIYEDNDGNMWFGTPGAGLFRYDGKSLTCINDKDKKGVVRAIHQDKMGKIWFGNNAEGIYQYDGKSLVNFSEEQEPTDLKSALAIEEDKEGNIWFATFSSGLWKYNLSSLKLVDYTNNAELKTNYISTLYRDKKDRIWIGTGKGDVFFFNGNDFQELKGAN